MKVGWEWQKLCPSPPQGKHEGGLGMADAVSLSSPRPGLSPLVLWLSHIASQASAWPGRDSRSLQDGRVEPSGTAAPPRQVGTEVRPGGRRHRLPCGACWRGVGTASVEPCPTQSAKPGYCLGHRPGPLDGTSAPADVLASPALWPKLHRGVTLACPALPPLSPVCSRHWAVGGANPSWPSFQGEVSWGLCLHCWGCRSPSPGHTAQKTPRALPY